jgi:hypothetical protein
MVGMWSIDLNPDDFHTMFFKPICLSIYKAFDKSHTLRNFNMIPGNGLFVNHWSTLYQLDLNPRDFDITEYKLIYLGEYK